MGTTESIARAAVEAAISGGHEFGKTGSGRPFHKLCVDLDRAWAMCRLSRYERRILQYVREHTWGVSALTKAETDPCPIPAADLAEAWRVPRQRVGEAVNALIDDAMLVGQGGKFLIGKDVYRWGGGRIDPEDLEYCIVGATRLIAKIEAEKDRVAAGSGTEKRADSHGKTCGTEKRAARKNVPTRTEKRAETDESARNSVPPHIRNAPASEDSRKTKEETTTTKGPVVFAGRGRIFRPLDQDQWEYGPDDSDVAAPVEHRVAILATDDPGEVSGPPSGHPAPDGEREFDEFRDWAKDLTYETTRNIDQAEALWKRIEVWRGWKIPVDVIASYIDETCRVKYDKLTRKDIPSYVHAIMKGYLENPVQKVPPCPERWRRKPVAATPVKFDLEARARKRGERRVYIANRRKQILEGPADPAFSREKILASLDEMERAIDAEAERERPHLERQRATEGVAS